MAREKTVLEKWTEDIEEMRRIVLQLTNEAKAFEGHCHEDIRGMRETVVARQKAAETYWADFKKHIDALTQKAKAFEKRFMETVKGMMLHIWGEYKVIP